MQWLRACLAYGEYRGQSFLRFLAIQQIDPAAVPESAICAMAREMLLEAKIDPERRRQYRPTTAEWRTYVPCWRKLLRL